MLREKNVIKLFNYMIVICGVLLVFLTPPLAVPDECTHYINAYSYSIDAMNFFPDHDETSGETGKYLPRYICDFANKYKDNSAGALDEGYSFSEAYFDSWLPVSDDDRINVFWKSDLVSVNFFSYIVAATGMSIGAVICRFVGGGLDTAYNLLLAGRLANLSFYIIISNIAISTTPYLKKTMMLLLSLPMSIFLAASVSYDAILIPVSCLFFAEIIKLTQKNNAVVVEKKDTILIMICTLFLIAVKMMCAPFLLMLLCIPFKSFKTKKQYILSICVSILTGLVAILPSVLNRYVNNIVTVDTNEAVIRQIEYIQENPLLFPQIVVNSFSKYANFYLTGFVGKLGYQDTNFPVIYIAIVFFILLIVTIIELCTIQNPPNKKIRIGSFLLFVLVILAIYYTMYTEWTPLVEELHGSTVSGIQGRYFIPLCLYPLILFMNNFFLRLPEKIENRIDCQISELSKGMIVLSTMGTVLIILLRYWCIK